MTDPDPECEDAREAADVGEKPDLGHKADALIEALDGSDSGSDTRAGSLEGGAATGSDRDPDQEAVNAALASEGMAFADRTRPEAGSGRTSLKANDKADPKAPGDDVDAPTG